MKDRKDFNKSRLAQVLSLCSCFILMAVASVGYSSRLFGVDLRKNSDAVSETVRTSDGGLVVNTSECGKEFAGYAGPVPVEIRVEDGRIAQIIALENSESPRFFNKVLQSGITESYIGLTLDEAAALEVDAVSGATYSSNALIANIREGVALAADMGAVSEKDFSAILDWKTICALVVILSGAILPFFVKSQRFRIVQLIFNVAVLGFWTGSFISYTLISGYFSNGVRLWISVVPLLLLVVAFIYPLFGKKNHYCMWLCPLGSLQELAGKCCSRKIRLSPAVVRYLGVFREVLWAVLMMLMMTGIYAEWMNYELFTAFMFSQASVGVLVAAAVLIVLSFFIPRPYCRFVCPTGTLIKLSENIRE